MRTVRYLNLRYLLIRDIMLVMSTERFFGKLTNAKKYIMIYYVYTIEYLE